MPLILLFVIIRIQNKFCGMSQGRPNCLSTICACSPQTLNCWNVLQTSLAQFNALVNLVSTIPYFHLNQTILQILYILAS